MAEGSPVLGGDAEIDGDPLQAGRGEPEMLTAGPAAGTHEVVGDGAPMGSGGPEGLQIAMDLWRERMRAHTESACVHMAADEACAELYALPFVPALVARERERFTAYSLRTNGRNLLEDLVQEEVRLRDRIVGIDGEAVAFCPFAGRVPFQVTIAPRKPRRRFEDEGPLGATLLHDVIGRLERALGAAPAFNLWVRTAPRDAEHFCWRIELLPSAPKAGGLEVGTGVGLTPLAPEQAAQQLRDM